MQRVVLVLGQLSIVLDRNINSAKGLENINTDLVPYIPTKGHNNEIYYCGSQ